MVMGIDNPKLEFQAKLEALPSGTSLVGANLPGLHPNLSPSGLSRLPSNRPLSHKCPKCTYRSAWRSCVLTHMKLKHSSERPWQCTQCTKCYKLKHHLKQHMETAHGESPTAANRIVKMEASEDGTDTPVTSISHISMDAAAKQFLKLSASSSSGALPTTSLEALVHSAFSGHISNGLGDDDIEGSNGPSSPKTPRIDNELLSMFTNSGMVPSQLVSQISQNLGINLAKLEASNVEDQFDESSIKEAPHISTTPSINQNHTLPTMPENGDHIIENSQSQAMETELEKSPEASNNLPTHENIITAVQNSLSRDLSRDIKFSNSTPVVTNKQLVTAMNNAMNEMNEHRFKSNSAGVSGQYTCKHCLIIFPDNILFGLHMGQHCVSEPFKCNICSYVCKDRYDFMFHFAMGRHEKQGI